MIRIVIRISIFRSCRRRGRFLLILFNKRGHGIFEDYGLREVQKQWCGLHAGRGFFLSVCVLYISEIQR